jgi:hypothetical protein
LHCMRFWGIFLKTIYRTAARKAFKKLRTNSIEIVLKNSVGMIDKDTLTEIRVFLKSHQTDDGGFADRGGRSDLYYSLFGCYIAEALGIEEVMPLLKEYVKNTLNTNSLKGIHLKCAVILYAKLFGSEKIPPILRKNENIQAKYSDFINLLADYYSEEYSALYSIQRKLNAYESNIEMPCSITAAHMILNNCFNLPVEELEKKLNDLYRINGSYSAVPGAPAGDLLSTGVALYARRFVESDFRNIKPDCLSFIDSLYSGGGFCAASTETDPDVEYTFYGLLALGSLAG